MIEEMTAEQRKNLIVQYLETVLWALTMREVGQGAGLKKTPYLKRLLDELIDENMVLSEWVNEPRGCTQYFWLNREVSK